MVWTVERETSAKDDVKQLVKSVEETRAACVVNAEKKSMVSLINHERSVGSDKASKRRDYFENTLGSGIRFVQTMQMKTRYYRSIRGELLAGEKDICYRSENLFGENGHCTCVRRNIAEFGEEI